MTVTRDGGTPSTFELQRFDWVGPDRLEVVGTFADPLPTPTADPLLVVHGEGGSHELPHVAEATDEPQPGDRWRAAFAWQEPPDAFTTAELRLGELRVELPGLYPEGEPAASLAVHSGAAAEPPAGAGRVHLASEVLATRERALAAERELERAQAELERARADLERERAGREQDAARFREGLDAVERAAAEELDQARAEAAAAQDARARADQLSAALAAAADDVEQALARLRAAGRDGPAGEPGRL